MVDVEMDQLHLISDQITVLLFSEIQMQPNMAFGQTCLMYTCTDTTSSPTCIYVPPYIILYL
jgi:hypothetical protein